jgi:2-dehydro-3-deoxygalactonokinase
VSLLAVDWGSTSLRGALLDDAGAVQDICVDGPGMLSLRRDEFAAVFEEKFGTWIRPGTSCLISGMAGSRQGWHEAPYRPCPTSLDAIAQSVLKVPDFCERGWDIGIVPGLCYLDDGVPEVMRGEETQVFGAARVLGFQDATIVLPGTHSKWVAVRDGCVASFSTYMSGELFALLRKHSILAHSIGQAACDSWDAFDRGVAHARKAGSLSRAGFSTRTLSLWGVLSPEAAYDYLSGLVIGDELRVAAPAVGSQVVLLGAAVLVERYCRALATMGVEVTVLDESATWHGLYAVHEAQAHK